MRFAGWSTAAACAVLLTVSACGVFGSDDDEQKKTDKVEYPDDEPMVRSGMFGHRGMRAELEVHHVERWDDRSVLRFTATPQTVDGDDSTIAPNVWGTGALDQNHSVFRLLDPVNQRYYYPVRDESGETTIGSEVLGRWMTDASYKQEVHFPPLPEDVERLTLATRSTAGEFTGIPVVDEKSDTDAEEFDEHSLEAGDSVSIPLRDEEMAEEPERYGYDLYSVTEGSAETRSSSGDTETIGLHADVLFEFDEATLTDEAEEVLDGVVEDTRAEADPERPPITITGHTDSVGSDDYNQELSEDRAEAVREVLEDELGPEFEYETEGRGSEDPLAEEGNEDDEEARATNRRVEISYKFRQDAEGGESTKEGTETADARPEAAAPPAPFRSDAGEVVDSAVTDLSGDAEYELSVYPFYRDGAYLVGNVELRHREDQDDSVNPAFRPLGNSDYPGARFAGFSLRAPGDEETTYRAVRIGPRPEDDLERTHYVDSGKWPRAQRRDGATERVFVYFPDPGNDADTVTLDAGPFGEFTEVPIE